MNDKFPNDREQTRALLRTMLRPRWYERILGVGCLPKFKDEERRVVREWLAILDSMTSAERATPKLICASRIDRIALGAGVEKRSVRVTIRGMQRKFRKRRRDDDFPGPLS